MELAPSISNLSVSADLLSSKSSDSSTDDSSFDESNDVEEEMVMLLLMALHLHVTMLNSFQAIELSWEN